MIDEPTTSESPRFFYRRKRNREVFRNVRELHPAEEMEYHDLMMALALFAQIDQSIFQSDDAAALTRLKMLEHFIHRRALASAAGWPL